jgi:hypothetical protein
MRPDEARGGREREGRVVVSPRGEELLIPSRRVDETNQKVDENQSERIREHGHQLSLI